MDCKPLFIKAIISVVILSTGCKTSIEPTQFESVIMPSNHEQIQAEALELIAQNLTYPKRAMRDSTTGTIWVTFLIDKQGKASHFKVEKGVRSDLNNEALRVTKLLSSLDWEPAIRSNGDKMGYWQRVPITFELGRYEE